MEPSTVVRGRRRARRGTFLFVAATLLLATAVRAVGLDRESYWLDELCSVAQTRDTWPELWRELAGRDVHPPLYFALLKLWTDCFGRGEASARSLSVVAGVAAVVAAGRLGRTLGGRRAGATAMVLVACSPVCVYYAGEARAYSLLLALSLEATHRIARALDAPTPARLAAWVAVAALLPYTHVFGWFVVLAHAAAVLAYRAAGRVDAAALRRFVLAGALVVVAFAPWAGALARQVGRVEQGFWVPQPDLGRDAVAWLRGGDAGVVWGVGTLVAAAATVRRWWRRRRPQAALLAAGVLVPTALPFALSLVSQPIFLTKYAIGAAGLMLVAAAPTLARRPALAAVLCLAGLVDAVRDVHVRRHRADWRALGAFASRASGTPLVMTQYLARPLGHYLDPGVRVREVEPSRVATLPATFWLLNVHPGRTDPRVAPWLHLHRRAVRREAFFGAEAILWETPAADGARAPAP